MGLGSAFLRRIGLVVGSFALDAWPGLGNRDIHVEIHDGPAIDWLIDALEHPVFGIVSDTVSMKRGAESFARVQDNDPGPDRYTGGDHVGLIEPPSLVLRASSRQGRA